MEDEDKLLWSGCRTLEDGLYRFADEETDDVVCKVALRAEDDAHEVEYGIWRADDAEPSATGRLESRWGHWLE